MPYYRSIALSLLLLLQQHSSTAFHVGAPRWCISYTSTSVSTPTLCMTASIEESSTTIPKKSLESILEDGHGHINSNLAQAIYEWEVTHNDRHENNNIKKEQFSTRDGLRLVDELAREILSSFTNDDSNEISSSSIGGGANGDIAPSASSRKSSISYNDLVQEGMIALLRAMSTYDNYKSYDNNNTSSSQKKKKISTFEEYAKQSITSSFLHYMSHSSSQIRLPIIVSTTLQQANIAADKLRQVLNKEPSLTQVANEVNVKPEQLALYRKLYKSMVSRNSGTFVSVEDGMEVYDPTLAGIRSRRDLDSVSGRAVSLETSLQGATSEDTSSSSSITSDDQDDLTQLNSQEDDWTRDPPERSVAPLRDVLTDTEEINNPLSYTHHLQLNEELDEFLSETLTEEELTVIQLRFGLVESKYGGKGWTAKDIGERMGMDHDTVVKVASAALEKLRKAAANSSNGGEGDNNDAYVEVSL